MAWFPKEPLNPKFREWIVGFIEGDPDLLEKILSADPQESQRMIADVFRQHGEEFPKEEDETIEFRLQDHPLDIRLVLLKNRKEKAAVDVK